MLVSIFQNFRKIKFIFCLMDLYFRLFLKFENRQSGHFSTDGSISPIGYTAAFF